MQNWKMISRHDLYIKDDNVLVADCTFQETCARDNRANVKVLWRLWEHFGQSCSNHISLQWIKRNKGGKTRFPENAEWRIVNNQKSWASLHAWCNVSYRLLLFILRIFICSLPEAWLSLKHPLPSLRVHSPVQNCTGSAPGVLSSLTAQPRSPLAIGCWRNMRCWGVIVYWRQGMTVFAIEKQNKKQKKKKLSQRIVDNRTFLVQMCPSLCSSMFCRPCFFTSACLVFLDNRDIHVPAFALYLAHRLYPGDKHFNTT